MVTTGFNLSECLTGRALSSDLPPPFKIGRARVAKAFLIFSKEVFFKVPLIRATVYTQVRNL
jgi:hypothetical protein